ncbi:anti-sigma factor [Streptomyces sp. MI02-7b]|uniref:anti-sigma factor n=1 Tax=Streptomyces sp. MI02-7b TaxID=462941 RepID=UPI0029A370B6|nr:anti-sigma factor [Streptomyces sp. MI02-7b]MDX3075696.1 anti-sigma factor [Streptomyces sp. MI02-7b]
MSTDAELHTLTGAYALDALDRHERAEFEHHLTECEPCALEVRELTATAARLGLAAAEPVPPRMKDEVMRRIATVRQEPPRVTEPVPVRDRRRVRRAAPRTPLLTRFALAACLVAAAALGGVAVWQQQQLGDARQETREAQAGAESVARVLAAPDAAATTGKLSGGASGTVVVSRSQDRAVFFAQGLPALSGGRVYQLWFSDTGGTMRSAGLVPRPTPGTSEAVLLDGPVGDASGMGITVEPAGGSPRPTTQPLALMAFAKA